MSVVAGLPVFFAIGWWLERRRPGRGAESGLLVASLYVILDLPYLLAGLDFSAVYAATMIAHSIKLAAGYAGGALAGLRGRSALRPA